MTNYMLTHLNAKMVHEERLREAEQFRKLAIWRQGQLQTGWINRVSAWIDKFKQTFLSQNDTTQPATVPATVKPAVQHSPISEDEWLKIFHMVKQRKLSVEQAAQLLVTLNG